VSSNDWASLLPLVLLLVFAYLLLIRPARRRARDIHAVQSALSPGDEVMLTSGIFGVVTEVTEERFGLQISPGVEVHVARAAVARIIRDVPAEDAGATALTDADSSVDDTEARYDDEAVHDDGQTRYDDGHAAATGTIDPDHPATDQRPSDDDTPGDEQRRGAN
jgi:preprotein translocase subunit YajC